MMLNRKFSADDFGNFTVSECFRPLRPQRAIITTNIVKHPITFPKAVPSRSGLF